MGIVASNSKRASNCDIASISIATEEKMVQTVQASNCIATTAPFIFTPEERNIFSHMTEFHTLIDAVEEIVRKGEVNTIAHLQDENIVALLAATKLHGIHRRIFLQQHALFLHSKDDEDEEELLRAWNRRNGR